MQNIGTCVIVFDDKNHILLGERKNGYLAGTFGLPGGRIEIDEKVELTAQRELLEETGLRDNNLEFVGVVKENQGEYDFVHFVFVSRQWSGELQNREPEKCAGWEWYDFDNLPDNILPGHRGAITLLQSGQQLLSL